MPLPRIRIIAHRGASYDSPENTLAAFRVGWSQGADAVEMDLHLTADHRIVAIHDDTTGRYTKVARSIASQTLAELQTLDVGRWKSPWWAPRRWRGQTIPTLEEVFPLVPPGGQLCLEIKSDARMLPFLITSLECSGLSPQQTILIGFDLAVVAEAKRRMPAAPAWWVCAYEADPLTGLMPTAENLSRQARAAGLDGLDLESTFPIDATFATTVKAEGLGLYVWTVDSPRLARKLAAAGVEGIATNRPGWLRARLQAGSSVDFRPV